RNFSLSLDWRYSSYRGRSWRWVAACFMVRVNRSISFSVARRSAFTLAAAAAAPSHRFVQFLIAGDPMFDQEVQCFRGPLQILDGRPVFVAGALPGFDILSILQSETKVLAFGFLRPGEKWGWNAGDGYGIITMCAAIVHFCAAACRAGSRLLMRGSFW